MAVLGIAFMAAIVELDITQCKRNTTATMAAIKAIPNTAINQVAHKCFIVLHTIFKMEME
jgi:hypothetical protein